MTTLHQRFWKKVSLTPDCWEWKMRPEAKARYGSIMQDGKMRRATWVAWEMAFGPIPDGMHVLHTCDNTRCVRPTHLFLGTHADNMQDMVMKGRHGSLRKTHCPKGHPYDEVNTGHISTTGERYCRECSRTRVREAYHAKRFYSLVVEAERRGKGGPQSPK